ncbi:MAG: hypothetical protein MI785_19400, partial [Kiloniellales bacterium]|nr:hypothetical protein [Kiloniellales bacterium]
EEVFANLVDAGHMREMPEFSGVTQALIIAASRITPVLKLPGTPVQRCRSLPDSAHGDDQAVQT